MRLRRWGQQVWCLSGDRPEAARSAAPAHPGVYQKQAVGFQWCEPPGARDTEVPFGRDPGSRPAPGVAKGWSPHAHRHCTRRSGCGKVKRGASGQSCCWLFSKAEFRTQVTFHPRAAFSIGSQGKTGEKGGIKCREQNWCSFRGYSLGDSFTRISKPAANSGTCGWRQNLAQVPRLQAVRYVIVCNVRLCDTRA